MSSKPCFCSRLKVFCGKHLLAFLLLCMFLSICFICIRLNLSNNKVDPELLAAIIITAGGGIGYYLARKNAQDKMVRDEKISQYKDLMFFLSHKYAGSTAPSPKGNNRLINHLNEIERKYAVECHKMFLIASHKVINALNKLNSYRKNNTDSEEIFSKAEKILVNDLLSEMRQDIGLGNNEHISLVNDEMFVWMPAPYRTE